MFTKYLHITSNLSCISQHRRCDTTAFVRSSRNHYYPSRMYWGNQAKYLLVQSLIIKWISCNLLSKLSYHAAIISSTVFHHLKLNAADCRWISCRNIFISRSVMPRSGQRVCPLPLRLHRSREVVVIFKPRICGTGGNIFCHTPAFSG